MIVYINNNKEIVRYNESIKKEDIDKNKIHEDFIWIDDKIDFNQYQEGYETRMYLNDDNTIRYEFYPIKIHKSKQFNIIQEQQLIIMTAQADQYEQSLSNRLNDMEVQATLYEAILELGGNV